MLPGSELKFSWCLSISKTVQLVGFCYLVWVFLFVVWLVWVVFVIVVVDWFWL